MAETVVLQMPEALYQRLVIASEATQQSPIKCVLKFLMRIIHSPTHLRELPQKIAIASHLLVQTHLLIAIVSPLHSYWSSAQLYNF